MVEERLPARLVAPYVNKWLEEPGRLVESLCDRTDNLGWRVDERILLHIRQGVGNCTFDIADRLLCATENVEAWRADAELSVYYDMPLSEVSPWSKGERSAKPGRKVRCARKGCSNVWEPKQGRGHKSTGPTRKKYCSESCSSMAYAYRSGKRPTPSASPQGVASERCRNGHLRTMDNTATSKATGKRYCRDCAKDRAARTYRKHAEVRKQYARDYHAAKKAAKGGHES